jgi:hypothetical protein
MADIRWITAPIGGGKTFFAVMEFCKELERSERFCVNNLPLLLENAPENFQSLPEYCDHWINKPVDFNKRLFLLDREQSGEFWRYLPAGMVTDEQIERFHLERVTTEIVVNEKVVARTYGVRMPEREVESIGNKGDKQMVPDFALRTTDGGIRGGVFYQLDEVHLLFPSRNWQKTGQKVEIYMSQLRKLNDDLDLITQHPEKVDKNFRRNATEWLQVENMSKKSLFMGVTLAKRFRFHWYNQPEMPVRGDKPTTSGWYKIDGKKRQEFLYLTMVGVGVSGGLHSEGSRMKGRHPVVWVFGFLVIIIAAYLLPRIVEKTIQVGVHGVVAGAEIGVHKGVQSALKTDNSDHPAPPLLLTNQEQKSVSQQPIYRPVGPPVTLPFASASFPPDVAPSAGNSVQCVGVTVLGTNVEIMLSDGRIAYSQYGEVQGYGRRYVKVFGLPQIPIANVARGDSQIQLGGLPPQTVFRNARNYLTRYQQENP